MSKHRKYWGFGRYRTTTTKKVRLIEHNSKDQMQWGSHNDTETDLLIGAVYHVEVEIHSWHTRYYIGDKHYNSVCFEDVKEPENAN